LLPCEAYRRRCRTAFAIERRRNRRSGHDLFEVLLTLGDLGEPHGETTRCAVALHRRAGRDARFLEPRLETLAKLAGEAWHPRGRELFDTDFYQQLSIHSGDLFHRSSPSLCDRDHGVASRWTTTRRHDATTENSCSGL
jgi:hypothetical protein